jgi:hypothetical protein
MLKGKTGMRLKQILILLVLAQSLVAQKPVILSDFIQQVSISDLQLHYLEDPLCNTPPAALFSGMMDYSFRQVDFGNPDPFLLQSEAAILSTGPRANSHSTCNPTSSQNSVNSDCSSGMITAYSRSENRETA